MNTHDGTIVTPFDWRRYTAIESGLSPTDRARAAPRLEKKTLTRRQRWDRILAERWGNPYCKPGAL